MKSRILIISIFVTFINAFSNSGTGLLRFPDVFNNKVTFSYAGDIYLGSLDGGVARRLTSHEGYEMFPKFSPDGKKIAFTAQYQGNTEVYIISSEGGQPKRISYTATLNRDEIGDRMGPNNIVMGWTPDGSGVIFRSRQYSFNDFIGNLFIIDTAGGEEKEIPLWEGGFCSYNSDGTKLAFNRVFREFRTWKRYQGGMADDIWVFNEKTGGINNLTNNPHQDIIPMWINDSIYFLSDRTGTLNLFAINEEGGEAVQKTFSDYYDLKFASFDNNTIVYEKGGYIYKYDLKTGKEKLVNLFVENDNPVSIDKFQYVGDEISDADISPNGIRAVFSAHGDIFTVPAEGGFTRNITKTPGVHEKNPAWSPDGKNIAYVSDESGEFEIYMKKSDGSGEGIRLTKGNKSYIFNILWSPDGNYILFNDRDFAIYIVDVKKKLYERIDKSELDGIFNFSWAPNSKWVAYEKTNENDFNSIWIYNLETKEKKIVTDPIFDSRAPEFSKDGKFLAFRSARSYSASYSDIEWDYAYFNLYKLYIVPLKKDTKSPFYATNSEELNSNKEDDDTVFKIDFEDITERVIQLPVDASNYSLGAFYKNKLYYLKRSEGESDTKFCLFDLDKKKEVEIGSNIFPYFSFKGEKILLKSGGKWAIMPLPNSAVSPTDFINISEMKLTIDYHKEWNQVYGEAWRQMRDFFYVENMHGLNWDSVYLKYEPLLKYVNHPDDLSYLIGEMIGELNCSHAYINTGDKPSIDKINLGLLGARIEKAKTGYFEIKEIFKGEPWDNKYKSPLNIPGVRVEEGDFIVAINGEDVSSYPTIDELLIDKAGKLIELKVSKSEDGKNPNIIYVEPVSSMYNLSYYRFISKNRELISEKTNNEVGYIHIPNMLTPGLDEFVKYFYSQLDKKALIIDARGNGGGNVSPMIIERLQREIIRAKSRRGIAKGKPVPEAAFDKPMVLLVDKYSASDGDLFAYTFKKYNLGPVIGTRTWGGVVGIYGSLPFINGAQLRKPESASYSADKSEYIIEGHGVDPDIVVDFNPYKRYNGVDDQLNKAIEVIKGMIDENAKLIPDIPPMPVKTK